MNVKLSAESLKEFRLYVLRTRAVYLIAFYFRPHIYQTPNKLWIYMMFCLLAINVWLFC